MTNIKITKGFVKEIISYSCLNILAKKLIKWITKERINTTNETAKIILLRVTLSGDKLELVVIMM